MFLKPKKLYHGAAYYPELWDKTEIVNDVKKMKELGINVVRIGEFSWALLEPTIDNFNISLFDDVIEYLGENGIKTIFCTPTATPPRWLTKKWPDCLYVDKNMVKANHGSREHVCFNSLEYIQRTKIIVEKLAQHYSKNKNIIAWQLHNEYNCPPVNECVCDNCQREWQNWLKNKYQTIDNLNEQWGTGVWSTKYNSFDDVLAPRPTPNGHSTSMTTNYSLFTFDTVAKYNQMQVDILKKYVKVPLTHNTAKVFHYNQETIFEPLDFVSFDDYITQDHYQEIVFDAEMCRMLKPGVPFFEMETSCMYSANIYYRGNSHKKGFVAAEAVNQFFAGSIGFSYWLFRQHKSGTEMPHGHIVNSFGTFSCGAQNVIEVKKSINKINDFILKSKVKQAEVALLYSDKARMFSDHETLGGNNYFRDILDEYSALLKTSYFRDIIYEHSFFEGYKVIIVPYIMNISNLLMNKIIQAASNGATVILGPYSGIRSDDHNYYIKNCLGDIETYFNNKIVDAEFTYGQDSYYEAFGIKEKLDNYAIATKKGIGKISNGYLKGLSLISENKVGKGKIVFVGSRFGNQFTTSMLNYFIKEKVSLNVQVEEGIILYEREDDNMTYYCLINMSFESKKYTIINGECYDYFSNEKKDKGTLKSNEYVILKVIK